MLKVSLLATVLGSMFMGASTVYGSTTRPLPERNTEIIVECDTALGNLSEAEILKSQNIMLNNIKLNATTNYRVLTRYNVLNNAVAISVNDADVEAIRSVQGVKSVTLNTIHSKKTINEDGYYANVSSLTKGIDVEENISATTMQKPANVNDGEGTVIAILDSEFYLRGATENSPAWHHETFTELDDNTNVRFTFDNLTDVVKGTNAKRRKGKLAGEEGSLYFNNKVPFYYDYGGETSSYGKQGPADYDTSLTVSYHGSHVSSIATGNAPSYKGIAPKAQLVAMKVFTEFEADEVSSNLGFGSSTGAYDMAILSALEDCIKLGVDGINMSLGSDLDDFDGESITLKTLTKLGESGILSSIAAGNSGKSSYSFTGGYGNWTTEMVETGIMSSYANNAISTTVASAQPDRVFFENALKIGDKIVAFEDQIVNREGSLEEEYSTEYKMSDLIEKYSRDEFEYVYVGGFGTPADFIGKDVSGKIAVVNRGSINFADKYNNARDEGAIALIIINNDPTASDFNFRCSFGEGFRPTMPCALVLFKDKPVFDSKDVGSFNLIHKQVNDNVNKRTISSYSTDGATYNYDLKPDISTPGENIKGAVPPQKKEDKQNTPYSTYQYLSGTSMAAPNYAGCQSLVLSNVTKDVYADGVATADELKRVDTYRRTVDMRMMSTANPMTDVEKSPENGETVLTSPRLQGAGLVDLEGAINTDVYLEGVSLDGKKLNKSKIVLKNSSDIAKGDLKLSFLAHNESASNREYDVTLTVMRPALTQANKVLSDNYNYTGEIDNVSKISGITYWDQWNSRYNTVDGFVIANEAIKLTKDIEYYPTEEAYLADEKVVMKAGYWYNASTTSFDWKELPMSTFQSVADVTIATITGQHVVVKPGESTVTIDPYSLSAEEKALILANYEYGCAIEGYVTLTSTDGHVDLSIPYLGFYSGSDVNPDASYSSAPVAEPFQFEKSTSEIYPSDLVNDLAKSLIGKDNCDMGSLWVAGYSKDPSAIDTDSVLSNDFNLTMYQGFYQLGVDPYTGEPNSDGKLYVGSPEKSNTMLIQQFILRSVADNYFTITNNATGQVAFKSVLEDMLFGYSMGKYALYKSHVDGAYLGAGYVAHRAFAKVPLYDSITGEAFADGEYTVTFNYLLAATNTWVKKDYTIVIDSTMPEVTAVTTKGDNVRFEFKDAAVSYAVIGRTRQEVHYDASKNVYYTEVSKEFVNSEMEAIGSTRSGQTRLFVKVVDKAYGEVGAIIHFDVNEDDTYDFDSYKMVQGSKLAINNDFKIKNNVVSFIAIEENGKETTTTVECNVTYKEVVSEKPVPTPSKGGCGGSVIASCSLTVVASLIGLVLLAIFKKKKSHMN